MSILLQNLTRVAVAKVEKNRNKSTQYNMRRFIRVSSETRDQIMRKYDVTRQTVWEALSYISRGKRPDAIRKDALEMGGRYYEDDFMPQCSFRRTEDGWIQKFASGVLVTVVGCDVVISKGRKMVAEFENVTMDGYSNILVQAQQLAEKGMLEFAN